MGSISDDNVALIRRALDADTTVLAENVAWHYLSPVPELVAHFEGRDAIVDEWPRMLDQLTGGTFTKRVVDVWAVGDDLVVAHVEVDMTIAGEHHHGSSVVVYRVAEGLVIEGFDIPSALI
jgi:ketosteroid isomerase-like protein